jgi:predicted nucleotidyltransferase
MIDEKEVLHVATRIGEAANAERVILFGSRARGDAQQDSDVDLFIIADSSLPRFKRARDLYRLFRPYPFSMDIVVYTPQEVEKDSRSALSFVSRVLEEGETLYVRGKDKP